LTERANELEKQLGPEYHALFDALNDADPNSKDVQDNTSKDNGSRKDKRPNIGPAAWRHQNRDALNEAHMPFDFDELFLLFFFVAITLLLAFDAPYPSKQWRIANERRMNRLGR
jgi:hypothetical protein